MVCSVALSILSVPKRPDLLLNVLRYFLMFWNVLGYSGCVWDALGCFWWSWDVPRCFDINFNCLKCSLVLCNVWEGFRCSATIWMFWALLKMFLSCLEMIVNVMKCYWIIRSFSLMFCNIHGCYVLWYFRCFGAFRRAPRSLWCLVSWVVFVCSWWFCDAFKGSEMSFFSEVLRCFGLPFKVEDALERSWLIWVLLYYIIFLVTMDMRNIRIVYYRYSFLIIIFWFTRFHNFS